MITITVSCSGVEAVAQQDEWEPWPLQSPTSVKLYILECNKILPSTTPVTPECAKTGARYG